MRIFAKLLFASCLVFAQPAHADTMSHGVLCAAGNWSGARVGYNYLNNSEEKSDNAQGMEEILIAMPNERPEVGSAVYVKYGDRDSEGYKGTVIYAGYNRFNYVVISTQPRDLIEIFTINLDTGDALLSVPKAFFGMTVDTFAKRCRIVSVGFVD